MSAASTAKEAKATASGIVQRADTQQRIIPESRRADGSVRKERKVRPGFTPVEDVQRYRPERARQAEEARREGIPRSAMTPNTSTSSASSSPISLASTRVPASRTVDSEWRSSAANALTSSQSGDGPPRPRGNFAPLEPSRTPSKKVQSSEDTTASTPKLSSSDDKPWRSSRLRKQSLPEKTREAAERSVRSGKPDKQANEQPLVPTTDSSADDLADELSSLRIERSEALRGDRH